MKRKMRGKQCYVIHVLLDDKVKVKYDGQDGARRKITLHVEDTIFVQPDNPNKLKHRGRQAVIKASLEMISETWFR